MLEKLIATLIVQTIIDFFKASRAKAAEKSRHRRFNRHQRRLKKINDDIALNQMQKILLLSEEAKEFHDSEAARTDEE